MSKRRLPADDDGRVIAGMNVEGMPWYCPAPPAAADPEHGSELTKHETLLIMLSAMKWAFLATGALSLGGVLFILFCVKVWFRA
jgi:hypothetical protein